MDRKGKLMTTSYFRKLLDIFFWIKWSQKVNDYSKKRLYNIQYK